MEPKSTDQEQSAALDPRAAIFVDYDNLYSVLARQLADADDPGTFITDIIEELQRYLAGQDQRETSIITAYADFDQLPNGQALKRSLYLLGADPQFAPARLQRNASEVQLCVDAMSTLLTRPDVRTFAVVTGDRPYLPLVQQFRRHGRDTFVVTLTPPASPAELPPAEDDFFLDARNLLSESLRQRLGQSSSLPRPSTRDTTAHRTVDSEALLQTLEIIEEHFGQYDEVYLTPLLRKLSELLGPDADPKSLISQLEQAGAVWLEKRRGSPYDYTVLIVDERHPDVQQVHQQLYGSVEDAASSHDELNDDMHAFRNAFQHDLPPDEVNAPAEQHEAVADELAASSAEDEEDL